MKKLFVSIPALFWFFTLVAQSKNQPASDHLQADKAAIKSMVGVYKVTFDFAETFSPDTAYRYHNRKRDWGIEYVFPIEETDKKISLQHLLIVNDSIIIKHWRQDWIFENTELYNYDKDNTWNKIILTPELVKGQWTQKVYQVDDSPRYESTGTWIHIDGKHYWEGSCDAPLPRREFTVRNDYNVLRRHSRIEINTDGWCLNQDNEKILRENGIDKLLCWEKGMEKFTKGAYHAQPAIDWWNQNKNYWAEVRKTWDEIYRIKTNLQLMKKVDNQTLFEKLFTLGDESAKPPVFDPETVRDTIRKTIEAFIIKT